MGAGSMAERLIIRVIPANGYNGSVTFADRANRFQLNQFNLFLQRTVVTEGKSFDIGGRFDFMFGTDAIYTQAFGIPSFDANSGQPCTGEIGISICAVSPLALTASRFRRLIWKLMCLSAMASTSRRATFIRQPDMKRSRHRTTSSIPMPILL